MNSATVHITYHEKQIKRFLIMEDSRRKDSKNFKNTSVHAKRWKLRRTIRHVLRVPFFTLQLHLFLRMWICFPRNWLTHVTVCTSCSLFLLDTIPAHRGCCYSVTIRPIETVTFVSDLIFGIAAGYPQYASHLVPGSFLQIRTIVYRVCIWSLC